MIPLHLDDLVARGRLTGYTVEEDTAYLEARVPTLTYRMYAGGAAARLNLGAFSAAVADLGAVIRLSRVRGNVAYAGLIQRSSQVCLTAEFASERTLDEAVEVVRSRFVAAPSAAPGSWRYPDVRVAGAAPVDTCAVFAHRWAAGRAKAVALTLEPEPPAPRARTVQVRVLKNWVDFLQRRHETVSGELRALAFSPW